MEKTLLEALEAFYTGNIKKAEANIYVYMKQPVGIGEHPDIIDAMHSQVETIAENEDNRAVVRQLLVKWEGMYNEME